MIDPPLVPIGEMARWGDTTIPFAANCIERMPEELGTYLRLAKKASALLGDDASLAVEPMWDGCKGRWLNFRVNEGGVIADLCAVALFEPDWLGEITHVDRALPILERFGWTLEIDSADGEDPSGFWRVTFDGDTDERVIAATALSAAHALFGLHEPSRWFVSMEVLDRRNDSFTAACEVDLRGWLDQLGLPAPNPTKAPVDTEPWVILCVEGLHDLHEPPCRE